MAEEGAGLTPQTSKTKMGRRSIKKHKMKTEERTQNEILDLDLEDDENDDESSFIPISQKGSTKETAISVDQYSEDREVQLAIMASLLQSTPINQTNFINLTEDDQYLYYDDDLHMLNFMPVNTPFGRRTKSFLGPTVTEIGQSSISNNDPPFVCEICVETKASRESFKIQGCNHSYCGECIVRYVDSKLQENITSIRCPVGDCGGLLDPEYCRDILPQHVFQKWGNALCEAVVLGDQKFYCPFKDCSALLIDDGGEVIRESECPYCRRLFCAQCKVAWHAGIECAEFQKLNKDEREREDIMLMKLAQDKKWKRCPNCRYYVEKKDGCFYMRCRCGYTFCYNCGGRSNPATHLCPQCNH